MDLLTSYPPLVAITLAPWMQPLWMVGVGVVVVLAILVAVAFLLSVTVPKISAIARTTAKEAVSQPLFYLLLGTGVVLLVVLLYLPYFTFGEDVKVVEENGLTLVMIVAVILGIWTASTSIAEEIEGRTALTVLCKPISRRDFILGKFLGILAPVLLLFVLLGAVFLGGVSYKVKYDARETAQADPTWEQCEAEVVRIAPGLVLGFFEAVVLTAVSVAISTRLPMLPNLVICVSFYILGHLVPMLAQSAIAQQMPLVPFFADLLSTVLPVLDPFNIYGAIWTNNPVPMQYIAWAAGYCVLYSGVAMMFALLLFEDRDLA